MVGVFLGREYGYEYPCLLLQLLQMMVCRFRREHLRRHDEEVSCTLKMRGTADTNYVAVNPAYEKKWKVECCVTWGPW